MYSSMKGGTMKSVRMISWMLTLTTALLACQSAELSTSAPVERAYQSDSSDSRPESATTQAMAPALSQEEITMIPVTPPDEASKKMVILVKGHLSQRLGIAVDQIVLSDVKPVVWRDASLGCPKPAIDYIPMETPGYKILLEAGGQTYNYHTDADKRFVLCNRL
jgi:hypothetical protein